MYTYLYHEYIWLHDVLSYHEGLKWTNAKGFDALEILQKDFLLLY